MGDLEDAIREHLELKRRRGADPAALAREEHEALAPVTRSHPVVVARAYVEVPDAHEFAATAATRRDQAAGETEHALELDDDATQEFRVEHDGDWLAAGD